MTAGVLYLENDVWEHAYISLSNHRRAVHFNQYAESKGRFGRTSHYAVTLILAGSGRYRFNGLANASQCGDHGCRHVSRVAKPYLPGRRCLSKADLPAGDDVARYVRTVATKEFSLRRLPAQILAAEDHPAVLLTLDYWVLSRADALLTFVRTSERAISSGMACYGCGARARPGPIYVALGPGSFVSPLRCALASLCPDTSAGDPEIVSVRLWRRRSVHPPSTSSPCITRP